MSRVSIVLCILSAASASGQKLRGASSTQSNATSARSGCKGSWCDGVPDDRFAVLVDRGSVTVSIGNSLSANELCVNADAPVECAKDAADLGKRLNDDDHKDTFDITVRDGTKVCARRNDKNEGWGQFLKIACKAVKTSEKCMCLTSPEGNCACKGCTDAEQQLTCTELLGPCACQRSQEAVCDCNGYCHSSQHRQEACEDEPGCLWTGMWCEAQIGMLWS